MSEPLGTRDNTAAGSGAQAGDGPAPDAYDPAPELLPGQAAAKGRDAAEPQDARSPMLREYEARRCHVCQARHPSFGFGPPLTRKGHTLWACGAHRDEVNGMLSRPLASPPKQEQRRLL